MKKIILLFVVALSVAVALCGCGKEEPSADKKIESVTRTEKEDTKTVADTSDEKDKEEPAAEETEEKEEVPDYEEKEEPVTAEKEEAEVTEAKTEDEPAKKETADVNLEAIKTEIVKTIGATDGLDFNANSINALYGIAPSDMKQCTGFSVMAGTFPHEVVMIEAADDSAAAKIEAAFDSKIDTFTQQSKNYDAANYALAQKCKVQKHGRFYALFLSPDYDAIMTVYKKYVK